MIKKIFSIAGIVLLGAVLLNAAVPAREEGTKGPPAGAEGEQVKPGARVTPPAADEGENAVTPSAGGESEHETLEVEVVTPVASDVEGPARKTAVTEGREDEKEYATPGGPGDGAAAPAPGEADLAEPIEMIMPPTVRKAAREDEALRGVGGEIADRDLEETVDLMEKAAAGEVVIPEKGRVPAEPPAEPELPEEIPVEKQMILFDFKDAEITHVLRLMSRKAGVNIIYGPDITGTVTLSLETEIPWEKALSLILHLHDYAYVRDGNIYRVIPVDELEKEPTRTETFELSYSTAKEVMGSVIQMLTAARGQIKADERSNTLIITDVPAKLDQISRIIKKLDRRTPQVLIEARIVELSDDFGENIGVDWEMLRDWDISYGQPPGDDDHLMEFTDSWTDIDARNLTREFTGRSQRDATIIDPTTGQTTHTVVSTFPGEPSGTTTTTDSTAATSTDRWTNQYIWDTSNIRSDDTEKSKSKMMTSVLDTDQLSLALNFLQEQTDANIISHPKIVTADSRTAQVKSVRQYPIPKFQYNDETGRFAISDFEYKDIGVILDVTPYVNADNFITLQVEPEVSRYFEEENVYFTGATNVSIPVIHVRKAKTRVLIADGDTLVIGGLMREDEVEVVRKVPLFGDTPFVGRYVFSYSGTSIERRNLMIFVTATTITDENKDIPWKDQRENQERLLSEEKAKWWHPKKLDHGISLLKKGK